MYQIKVTFLTGNPEPVEPIILETKERNEAKALDKLAKANPDKLTVEVSNTKPVAFD